LKNIIILLIFCATSFILGWYVHGMRISAKRIEKDRAQIAADKKQSLAYRAVVLDSSRTVKVGERYIANVHLSVTDQNSPPVVLLGHIDSNDNFIPSGDTLRYDKDALASVYETTPLTIGKHFWEGEIITRRDTGFEKLVFHMNYNVVKNKK